ncbi:hypothetical protein NUM3379_40680 [Kineococcus sp. NUM-3379]
MTSAPIEPAPAAGGGQDLPETDLGAHGPAEDTGAGPTQPPGYPEAVDPAEGPVPG